MAHFDVVVIGAGPGGYVAALRAGALGLRTALVEEGELGGTCLNVGCIPTKAMLHAAEALRAAEWGREMGLTADTGGGSLAAFCAGTAKWRAGVVETLRKGVAHLLGARGVEVVRGRARLSAEREVTVGSGRAASKLAASHVILATGSEPVVPDAIGPADDRVMTSTGALALEGPPASVAVIGGGYIGCEFASYYLDVGAKVTVVEMLPEILAGMEPEIRKEIERSIKRRRGKIVTGARVEAVERTGDGVSVKLDGKDAVEAERALVAVGRRPRTSGIGLEELGVEMEGGLVKVDPARRSSLPWLYAIGDVTPGTMLAHRASHDGVAAAESIAGVDRPPAASPVPACIFTRPEAAAVGLTEADARGSGREVKTGVFQMRSLGRAHAAAETAGVVKIVADAKTEQVLGVHVAGERATEIIAAATLAVRLEATLEELATTIHAHPTFAEALMEAAAAARNEGIHSVQEARG